MKRELIVLVFFISLITLVLGGCAAKDDTAAHAEGQGKSITISTGDFYEACDKWNPGDKVTVSFTSSKPVQFDIHYHQKHAKAYAVEKTVTDSFEGSFTVQSDDIHCCMWKNNNANYVTLTFDMGIEKQ